MAGMLGPACPVERIPILRNRWAGRSSHTVSMLHTYVTWGGVRCQGIVIPSQIAHYVATNLTNITPHHGV